MTTTLHVYQDNDCIWVVAESAEDAARAYAEFCGEETDDLDEVVGPGEEYDPANWDQCPDDQPLTIREDEDEDDPESGLPATMTCGEWVTKNGRGFLCTTENG